MKPNMKPAQPNLPIAAPPNPLQPGSLALARRSRSSALSGLSSRIFGSLIRGHAPEYVGRQTGDPAPGRHQEADVAGDQAQIAFPLLPGPADEPVPAFDVAGRGGPRKASLFFNVVEGRYRKNSTILATNIDFKALGGIWRDAFRAKGTSTPST